MRWGLRCPPSPRSPGVGLRRDAVLVLHPLLPPPQLTAEGWVGVLDSQSEIACCLAAFSCPQRSLILWEGCECTPSLLPSANVGICVAPPLGKCVLFAPDPIDSA